MNMSVQTLKDLWENKRWKLLGIGFAIVVILDVALFGIHILDVYLQAEKNLEQEKADLLKARNQQREMAMKHKVKFEEFKLRSFDPLEAREIVIKHLERKFRYPLFQKQIRASLHPQKRNVAFVDITVDVIPQMDKKYRLGMEEFNYLKTVLMEIGKIETSRMQRGKIYLRVALLKLYHPEERKNS